MTKISCIIVDDNPAGQAAITEIIDRYFNGRLTVVAVAGSVKDAVYAIKEHNPQIVFLEIELPVQSGFRLFDYFSTCDFEVIFVTGHQEHAMMAIRHDALDFLLKPVNYIDLLAAMARYEKRQGAHANRLRIESLLANLSQGQEINRKIALPVNDGYQMMNLHEIVYCEAEVNYTRIHSISGKSIVVPRTLKLIAEILADDNFFRIHKSYLVNMNFLKLYQKAGGYEIQLETGQRLPVSLRKNDEFINALSRKTKMARSAVKPAAIVAG